MTFMVAQYEQLPLIVEFRTRYPQFDGWNDDDLLALWKVKHKDSSAKFTVESIVDEPPANADDFWLWRELTVYLFVKKYLKREECLHDSTINFYADTR
jgi:hypothetical protein